MADLKVLRKQICQERAKLSTAFQQQAAIKVADAICHTELFKQSQHIAAYTPINSEIDPTQLMRYAWDQEKLCYLPVLDKNKQLLFCLYEEGDPLINNRFDIPEPYITAEKLIDPQDLDIVITPLVGFDVDGNRMGMGGGYYDRTFTFTKGAASEDKPCLIGIAYEFQNISKIDKEAGDVLLDMVVTEIQLRDFT